MLDSERTCLKKCVWKSKKNSIVARPKRGRDMPLKMGNTLKETNHISIEVELVIDHSQCSYSSDIYS